MNITMKKYLNDNLVMHKAIYVHGHEFSCSHKNNNTVFAYTTACGAVKC